MKFYRLYVAAEPGSDQALNIRGYLFEAIHKSLAGAWVKADNSFFAVGLSELGHMPNIPGGRRAVLASKLTIRPTRVGYIGNYGIFIQKVYK